MSVQDCLSSFLRLRKSFSQTHSQSVSSQAERNLARATAQSWFQTYRPPLVQFLGETSAVKRIDASCQKLVRLSAAISRRTSYLDAIRNVITDLRNDLLVSGTLAEWTQRTEPRLAPAEEVHGRLEALSPKLADSYKQVLRDIEDQSRLSLKGTANEIREILREVLEVLAPDIEVRRRDWFKQSRQSAIKEEEKKKGPTQAEKVHFILEARKQVQTEIATAQEAAELIETKAGSVVRAAYSRFSAASHVQKDLEEIRQMLRYLDAILLELLPR